MGNALTKKIGTPHYHAQLGLPDKGHTIKGLVVYWSMARINDLWDGSMDKRKVRSLVPCCGQDGNRAQVPQHPIDSNRYKTYIYIGGKIYDLPL